MNINNVKKLILILILIGLNTHVYASEKDAIANANLALAAFSCFTFSSYIKDQEESERLFKLGYEASIAFYNYASKHEISNQTLRKDIPSLYLMVGGPNPDFNTGQIFSSIGDIAMKKISYDSMLNFVYDEDSRKLKAEALIRENNCRLLK